jgi:serine/threonine-protein kinase
LSIAWGRGVPILTAQERLGTRLGDRYRVDRVLAQGGMSVLFEARDLRARRMVALKLLRAEDCAEERRKIRFSQEMRLTAELRHPNVVDVLDLGEDETGVPYLVMELLHGRSLQAELDQRGTLGLEDALAILLPVMQALAVVHAAGVVHRDVKPDNIFLHVDPRGTLVPKLIDFGIAKDPATTLATRTGAVLGTPDYMAPEQLLAGVVGPSADIWAAGAVLYRALSGETPFHAATSALVIARLTREPAPPLRVSGLASPICAAIDRALSRETTDRYPDMHAFSAALVLCAREAGLKVSDEPPARLAHDAHAGPPQRTLTAPSRSIDAQVGGRRIARGVVLGGGGALLLALLALLYTRNAPAPGRAAAHDSPQVASVQAGAQVQHAALPAPAALPLPAPQPAPVAKVAPARPAAGTGTADGAAAGVVAPRVHRPVKAARAPRATAAARPADAQQQQQTFSNGLSAGDFPIAVEW